MKGNTLNEFMDDLYSMGGPEKEFLYKDKRYFLQCETVDNMIEMVIFECFGEQKYIYRCKGKDFAECVEQFKKAKIFDGKNNLRSGKGYRGFIRIVIDKVIRFFEWLFLLNFGKM